MDSATDILIRKLKEHTRLSPEDVAAIATLSERRPSSSSTSRIVPWPVRSSVAARAILSAAVKAPAISGASAAGRRDRCN